MADTLAPTVSPGLLDPHDLKTSLAQATTAGHQARTGTVSLLPDSPPRDDATWDLRFNGLRTLHATHGLVQFTLDATDQVQQALTSLAVEQSEPPVRALEALAAAKADLDDPTAFRDGLRDDAPGISTEIARDHAWGAYEDTFAELCTTIGLGADELHTTLTLSPGTARALAERLLTAADLADMQRTPARTA